MRVAQATACWWLCELLCVVLFGYVYVVCSDLAHVNKYILNYSHTKRVCKPIR